MPLITSVGLTNEQKAFPVAISFCPGETAESYSRFFGVLRVEVFTDGAVVPRSQLSQNH